MTDPRTPPVPHVFTRRYKGRTPIDEPIDVDLTFRGLYVQTATGIVELRMHQGRLRIRTPHGHPVIRPWMANVLDVSVQHDDPVEGEMPT